MAALPGFHKFFACYDMDKKNGVRLMAFSFFDTLDEAKQWSEERTKEYLCQSWYGETKGSLVPKGEIEAVPFQYHGN